MSALGHYLEAAGIPTVSISLVREHSEAMHPPRALWVPFELGRPLGPPGAAEFQRRVLASALGLLERPHGPVLEDFPDDAPAGGAPGSDQGAAWVCPVSFPAPAADAERGLGEAVAAEVQSLKPWYELGVERRGRTTVGLSGLDVDAIVTLLERYAETGDGALPRDASAPEMALKHALDDLLAFYQEAAAAQPGTAPSSRDLLVWFWTETRAAALFRAVRERALASAEPKVKFVVQRLLTPRVLEAVTGAAS